jgi:threonine dehydrogenase-like Zn-dependent dehydrogenase
MSVYEQMVEWQPTLAMVKGVSMIGCIAGRLGEALALMRSGKIKTQPLITHEFPLDEITEAFEMQAKPAEAVKVVIKP